MLRVVIKLIGEPGSGKTTLAQNLPGFLKGCPHEFEAEVWTKQPTSPVWTRELVMKSNGQVLDTTEVTTDKEP